MIPQQRVGQTHCVFIELIHLLPSPLSPTRRVLGVPATTLTSPPIPCALSKVDNILGFRLRSRHAHKQQRKLASLAGKAAQRLMASWRCALKAIDQTEFRGKGKRSPEYFHREQERWESTDGERALPDLTELCTLPHHNFCILALCPSPNPHIALGGGHLPPAKMLLKTGRAPLALNLTCGQYLTGPAITPSGARRPVKKVSRGLGLPMPYPPSHVYGPLWCQALRSNS